MDNKIMPSVERVSALARQGERQGALISNANPEVTLTEVGGLSLWQLVTWPDTLQSTAQVVVDQLALGSIPGFSKAVTSGTVSMLRTEPLKFWVIGSELSEIDASDGAVIDLSHSRTHIRVTGNKATTVLNSYLPLDLREQAFPVGSVASTAFHHVGVTLWRSENGYELFMPRGFALSLWELLVEVSEQYELAVV